MLYGMPYFESRSVFFIPSRTLVSLRNSAHGDVDSFHITA